MVLRYFEGFTIEDSIPESLQPFEYANRCCMSGLIHKLLDALTVNFEEFGLEVLLRAGAYIFEQLPRGRSINAPVLQGI